MRFHCRCAVFCQFYCKPDLVQRQVKKVQRGFQGNNLSLQTQEDVESQTQQCSPLFQYYSSAKNNKHAPGVSIIRRQYAITCGRNVVRSDTQQTHFSLSANGQGSVDKEHTEQVMDNYLDTSFELSTDQLEHKDGHKSWTESHQKNLFCSSCTDEHEPRRPMRDMGC